MKKRSWVNGTARRTGSEMPVQMGWPGELCRAEVAEVALRDGGLVPSMRAHPGHGARLGQLDHLAVEQLEGGRRLRASTRAGSRVVVGGHRRSSRWEQALYQTTGETWEGRKKARLRWPELRESYENDSCVRLKSEAAAGVAAVSHNPVSP